MARCFVTGVQIRLDESWVLDVSEVHRAIRQLKSQLAALEGLLAQLGDRDEVHLKDSVTGRERVRRDCRLVCESVAVALGGVCPGRPVFVKFRDWKQIRDQRRAWIERKAFPNQSIGDGEPVDCVDSCVGSLSGVIPGPDDDLVPDSRERDDVTPDGERGNCHGTDRIWDAGDLR